MKRQVKKIYNQMQDDLSKSIFENCLAYYFFDNPRFYDEAFKRNANQMKNFLRGKRKLIVYGIGEIFKSFKRCLSDEVDLILCDSDVEKHNKMIDDSFIYSFEKLQEYIKDKSVDEYLVFVTFYSRAGFLKIKSLFVELGFCENNIIHLIELRDKLFGKPYFENSIIKFTDNEVFVDAGSYDFSDSIEFMKRCNNYNKIIAFEPNKELYSLCLNKINNVEKQFIYSYGLWSKNDELVFNENFAGGGSFAFKRTSNSLVTKVAKLDDICKDRVTFIKMDIEGAELNALKGAEQIILKERPKLAICVYHRPKDIFEIPSYILSLHSDYKFYLRSYSEGILETVLYAI